MAAPSLSHGSKQGKEAMARFQYDPMDEVRSRLIQIRIEVDLGLDGSAWAAVVVVAVGVGVEVEVEVPGGKPVWAMVGSEQACGHGLCWKKLQNMRQLSRKVKAKMRSFLLMTKKDWWWIFRRCG